MGGKVISLHPRYSRWPQAGATWAWLFVLLSLFWLAQPGQARAQTAPATEITVPALSAQAPIVDQAGVLNADEIASLHHTLRSIDATYGVRAGILVVTTAQPDGIEALANALGNEWHIGSRNGLLMVVAVQEHAARIEVSRGLEGLMPDLYVHKVLHESMSPAFAKGHYYEGLSAGLARLGIRLSSASPGDLKPRAASQGKEPSEKDVQVFFIMQVLLLGFASFSALIGWLLELTRRWWSVVYALTVGGAEFGLACIFLSTPGAAVVGVVCGVLAGALVWRQANKLAEKLSKLPVAPVVRTPKKARNKKRVAAAAAGAAASSSVWANSSSSSSSSGASFSSSDSSSSSSSDSSSGDFGGGGSSDSW